jgi:hypothetical protein
LFFFIFLKLHNTKPNRNGGCIEKWWTIWLLLHMIDLDIITNVIVSFWLRVIMCVFVWIPIVFFFKKLSWSVNDIVRRDRHQWESTRKSEHPKQTNTKNKRGTFVFFHHGRRFTYKSMKKTHHHHHHHNRFSFPIYEMYSFFSCFNIVPLRLPSISFELRYNVLRKKCDSLTQSNLFCSYSRST